MLRVLAAWPLVVLVAAATDTLLVRARLPHRGTDPQLFLQALLLWAAGTLLALVPAGAWLAWRKRAGKPANAVDAAAVLAFSAFAPVLVHARLDAFSALGGDLSALRSARPWLEAALALALLAAVLWALARLATRVGPRWVAVALGASALAAGFLWGPARDGRDPDQPLAKDKPNLLLLVWDTTRAQSLSLYGYDKPTTPNLERLAAESVVFEEARSPSRYTLTSHLSMLTGVYPSDHGARMTRQRISPRETPSVAANLRAAGYRTGAFVGTGVLSFQTGVAFGFEHYDDQVDPPVCDTHAWALVHDVQSLFARLGPPFSQNGQPHWFQDFFRPADQVLARAQAWIDDDDPRPWFCMINLYDVHWPYVPPQEHRERWVEPYDGPVDGFHERSDKFPEGYRMQARDDGHLRGLYDAELHLLDERVDRFLDALDLERNQTAVILTSDHGEAFGEGGEYEHGDILEPQVRIPFLVRLPSGKPPPAPRVHAPVSGIDVAPTLLSLAGLPIPEHYFGVDVLAIDQDPAAPPRAILVEDRDQMRRDDVRLVLYEGHWKLVRRGLGEKQRFQLYDLRTDPVGLDDVAAEHPEVVERMTGELLALRARWGADDVKDQEGTGFLNRDALKQLGYTADG